MIHGVYDIDGVSLSMPAIVGADGIESDIPINLSGEEALKLKESADSLKRLWRQLNYKFYIWKEKKMEVKYYVCNHCGNIIEW